MCVEFLFEDEEIRSGKKNSSNKLLFMHVMALVTISVEHFQCIPCKYGWICIRRTLKIIVEKSNVMLLKKESILPHVVIELDCVIMQCESSLKYLD